jgi:multidrug efflux pump subunit AcrB
MVLITRLTLLKVNIKIYLGKIINRRAITFCTCRVCAGTWLISSTVPGFIPNEDQGMFYAIIQTPLDLH